MALAPERPAGTDAESPAPGAGRVGASTRDPHATARALIAFLLDNPQNSDLPQDNYVMQLALQARRLEHQLSSLSGTAPEAVQMDEIVDAAENIRRSVAASVRNQMLVRCFYFCICAMMSYARLCTVQWTPLCMTNSAEWAINGSCPGPRVFMHLFGLGIPPTGRTTKLPMARFISIFGRISSYSESDRGEYV